MRTPWLLAPLAWLALLAPPSGAAPCVSATLESYLALGPGGCTIGPASFEGFAVFATPSGATPISAGAVLVSPSVPDPATARIGFQVDAAAAAGELLEILIAYTVSAATPLNRALLTIGGASVTPDGAVTGVEDLCLGGSFDPGGPTGCSGLPLTLIAFDVGVDQALSAMASFAPVGQIAVVQDVAVDGGTLGAAALGSTVDEFRVPEPTTALLVAAAGLALTLRRSRHRASQGAAMRVSHPLSALLLLATAAAFLVAHVAGAANHREAPLTALDHKADITDVYAFRSYGPDTRETHVTLIMSVDPVLEPANGPNWFPFDPDILYAIKVDNDNDARADVVFQFRFATEQRLPGLFQAFAGVGSDGVRAPTNSPPPVPPGAQVVPPRITSFLDLGLGQRQSYRVTLVRDGVRTPLEDGSGGRTFFAVPANVGPRTMDYPALFDAGIHSLSDGVRVFAGTTDDAFWIDLGGAFDTFNLRAAVAPGVLSPSQDASSVNFASDSLSGFGVNSIAIEVPIAALTRTGAIEPATSTAATIGVWATTSRRRVTVRRPPFPTVSSGSFAQVQRMGNPLVNELLVGTGSKDRFSMEPPHRDSQFVSYVLDPSLARVVNALTGGGIAIPTPPRTDLLPLLSYTPPVAAQGTPGGPVADLLRLNTGVPPTQPASASRLGLLGGDPAGFPNGRRVFDDVTDISLRLVVGGVLAAPFTGFNPALGGRLGDGVNVNDAPFRDTFPYLAHAPSGRDRRHLDPGEPGCTAGLGAPCSP